MMPTTSPSTRNVVVVGSINVDIITRVGELPAPGQTLRGSDAVIRPGGKGANQAVAAARLGAPTTLVAAVGEDHVWRPDAGEPDRRRCRHLPRRLGRWRDHGPRAHRLAADGENTIVVTPGANVALGPASVGPSLFGRGDVLLLQLEIPVDTCLAAASAARAAGARVLLNAAPLTEPGHPVLLELCEGTDVLVVNEAEAIELAGLAAPSDVDGWFALARQLPTRASVITLGARGAVVSDGERGWWQPAFAVPVVDTPLPVTRSAAPRFVARRRP